LIGRTSSSVPFRFSSVDNRHAEEAQACRRRRVLEHFPEKWVPVFRRKCDKIKKPERFSDSIESENALQRQPFWAKKLQPAYPRMNPATCADGSDVST
jgi:superfamily II DNA helicase RecQ